ncbi:hypothetical protein GN958_ATG17073 [Phytophthora infestans]|nr:hypothetical protein GN958_ATG17073 [Phytophthora infestans]
MADLDPRFAFRVGGKLQLDVTLLRVEGSLILKISSLAWYDFEVRDRRLSGHHHCEDQGHQECVRLTRLHREEDCQEDKAFVTQEKISAEGKDTWTLYLAKEDSADDIDDSASQRLSAAMHPGRASTKVSWLKITDPDVVDFMHGVKDLGPSVTGGGKRMDKTDKPLSFSFATAEADSLHVIVLNVPEYVKENLQE